MLNSYIQIKGFVIASETEGIFSEAYTFATSERICRANFKEWLALDGESMEDRPGWKPKPATMTITLNLPA